MTDCKYGAKPEFCNCNSKSEDKLKTEQKFTKAFFGNGEDTHILHCPGLITAAQGERE